MRYNRLIWFDVSVVLRKQMKAVRSKENGKKTIKATSETPIT